MHPLHPRAACVSHLSDGSLVESSQEGARITATETAHVCLDENGTAWIEGTTTKVLQVVLNQQATGAAPEELQGDMPHLTLAQIQAALACYKTHTEQVETEIARRLESVDAMQAESTNQPSRAELLARLRPKG